MCEIHPAYRKKLNNYVYSQTMPNLNEEIEFGMSYRNLQRKNRPNESIPFKKASTEIPLKLCRNQEKKMKESSTKKKQLQIKSTKKLSFIEKSILSQEQYMEYLSTPNLKSFMEPIPKKIKKSCPLEPCSPRLLQLAIPNKRRVYANWKAFHEHLPTEVILRFEQILYSKNSLDPKEARCYYGHLDREKKKQMKAKKLQKRKNKIEKEKNASKWLEDEINKTVETLIEFVKEEPLFVLNYKQLMLSDSILNQTNKKTKLQKPRRNTKKAFKKTIIDISDKLAIWIDTIIRFVDIQAIDSDEDISQNSLTGETNEEEYQNLSTSDEIEDDYNQIDYFKELNTDLLKKLIKILSHSPDKFLDSNIHTERITGITYRDILAVLIQLNDEFDRREDGGSSMEQILVLWAMMNDPQDVDEKLLKKIKEVAFFLEEYFRLGAQFFILAYNFVFIQF